MSVLDEQRLRPRQPWILNHLSDQARGLVAWWPMAHPGGNTLFDLSGAAYHGTLTSGPAWSADFFGNSALSFDGTDDYVTFPTFTGTPSDGYTVSAWICRQGGTGNRTILSWKYSASWTLIFRLQGDQLFAYHRNGGSSFASPSSAAGAIADRTWYHAVVVWDKTTLRLYVNGTQVNSVAETAIFAWDSGTNIGRQVHDLGEFFQGQISDVRVYNRGLSAGEVWTLYEPQTRHELYYPIGQRLWFIPQGGTAVALETTIASTSTVTASLSVAMPLAATIASASSVSASLSAAMPLAATVASASTVSASLSAAMPLACTIASVSAVSADLTIAGSLGASIASASTVTASLSVAMPLAATIASTSAVTASLTNTFYLSTTIASASSVSAALSMTRPLSATIASSSAVVAALSAAIPLQATIASVSTVTAVISGGEVQSPLGRLAVSFGLKYSLSLSFTVAGMALSTDTDIGDVVTTTATCTNSAGTVTNPTAMSFFIQEPSGVITEYVYGTDDEVDRPSTGVFTFDFPPTSAGKHVVRAVATGALIAAQRDAFTVRTQY